MKVKPKPNEKKYCLSLSRYERFKTREVNIGDVILGGNHPIRIQSMTTTDTMDTDATVEQSIRIIEKGADYVRITAPSKKDAENLKLIKEKLVEKGYHTPLIADIHFTPNAADLAADYVEKVRINPGNYADKKKFDFIEYTDESYQAEIDRIEKRFIPLVEKLKKNKKTLRIGTNHGSLSDRIMSRFGDTPLGMVESALEFVRMCRKVDYHDIVLSMKASNTQVMVQAYRLLIYRMLQDGYDYPVHLGVTEAGDGEDGRIKSAVGIGTLLEDGIGDTIRVSLTEEPEFEIPVARKLADRYKDFKRNDLPEINSLPYNPYEYNKRKTNPVNIIGGENVPVVISDLSGEKEIDRKLLKKIGYHFLPELDKWKLGDQAPDYLYTAKFHENLKLPGSAKVILDYPEWLKVKDSFKYIYPILTSDQYLKLDSVSEDLFFISCSLEDIDEHFINKLKKDNNAVLVLEYDPVNRMAKQRLAFIELMNQSVEIPVIIKNKYEFSDADDLTLFSAIDFGALFIDGMGDGIWNVAANIPIHTINRINFGILQASRTRISKTEYISCPSCGRTLFDLQETTAKIKEKTHHLKGVKIGIMGCIVNGPGEMADADFGYVGSGVGKITLYKGKEVVKKNVNSDVAVNELIQLIKDNDMWVEEEKNK
ncbi:MAG: 4-hydroxy-3-methylbut-2-en-1-yl diphosphate synthase [Chitinophagaceae bacterium]|nr:MAG: 4-hydroxy-3-methylbut-2-en-1-yl diphosphate synthase [Chitinophagaceae bacterium]